MNIIPFFMSVSITSCSLAAFAQSGTTSGANNFLPDSSTTAAMAAAPAKLVKQSVVRINKRRYLRFDGSDRRGVLFPAMSGTPEVSTDKAICPQHLKDLDEVLVIRDTIPLTKDIQSMEGQIMAVAQKCTMGAIKSPVTGAASSSKVKVEIKPTAEQDAKSKKANGIPAGQEVKATKKFD